MSYRMKIDRKSLNSARFISMLQRKIQDALIASRMTQQQVAEKLEVDRSVINRRLSGKANLTARSIAEFAYAFDKVVTVEFKDKIDNTNKNWTYPEMSMSVLSGPHTKEQFIKSSGTLESSPKILEQVI